MEAAACWGGRTVGSDEQSQPHDEQQQRPPGRHFRLLLRPQNWRRPHTAGAQRTHLSTNGLPPGVLPFPLLPLLPGLVAPPPSLSRVPRAPLATVTLACPSATSPGASATVICRGALRRSVRSRRVARADGAAQVPRDSARQRVHGDIERSLMQGRRQCTVGTWAGATVGRE